MGNLTHGRMTWERGRITIEGSTGKDTEFIQLSPRTYRARAKVPALNSPSLLGKFPEWLYMNSPIEIDASGGDGGDRFARKFFEESAAQDDRAGPSVFYGRVETLARNGRERTDESRDKYSHFGDIDLYFTLQSVLIKSDKKSGTV